MDIQELKDHCKYQIAHIRDTGIVLEYQLILEIIKENENLKLEVESDQDHFSIFSQEVNDLNRQIEIKDSEIKRLNEIIKELR